MVTTPTERVVPFEWLIHQSKWNYWIIYASMMSMNWAMNMINISLVIRKIIYSLTTISNKKSENEKNKLWSYEPYLLGMIFKLYLNFISSEENAFFLAFILSMACLFMHIQFSSIHTYFVLQFFFVFFSCFVYDSFSFRSMWDAWISIHKVASHVNWIKWQTSHAAMTYSLVTIEMEMKKRTNKWYELVSKRRKIDED